MRWLSRRTVAHLRRVAEWPDLADTRYRLLGELGGGGMGTVYLAEDTTLGRQVALKVSATAGSSSEASARLLREARIIAGLEHPGIVPVHDSGVLPDGRVFYAMKRVHGRRLDEHAPAVSLPERLRLFQRICDAVAFAHAHGVVHRDLKPENVMVGPFGEVLVLDWGVARLLDGADVGGGAPVGGDAAGLEPATADGTIVGTRAWMAPEQAGGEVRRVGPWTDVYALGAILHFLVAGRAPSEGGIDPAIPRPLLAAITRALSPAPEDRYASAESLSLEIARYLDGDRVLAHAEGPFERLRRLFVRYRVLILFLLMYLTARVLLIVFRPR